MGPVFLFFFRVFLGVVFAKLLLRLAGLEGVGFLLLFTLLFVANLYVFDLLLNRQEVAWRRRLKKD